MRAIIGALIGLAIVYLSTAALAWDFNPGTWGGFLRFWAICWAVVWGSGGLLIGSDKDVDAKVAQQRELRAAAKPSRMTIDQ